MTQLCVYLLTGQKRNAWTPNDDGRSENISHNKWLHVAGQSKLFLSVVILKICSFSGGLKILTVPYKLKWHWSIQAQINCKFSPGQLLRWYLGTGSFDNLLTVQYFLDFVDFLYPQHLPAWLSTINWIICKEKIIDNWEMASYFYWQMHIVHFAHCTSSYLNLVWMVSKPLWIWFTLTKKTKCDSNI